MEYDWGKIFEDKTDEELYDIITGKTFLSEEAKNKAQNELEKRGFDFNNIEKYKAIWEISEIEMEEEIANNPNLSVKVTRISWIQYFLIIAGIIILFLFVTMFAEPLPATLLIFIILATSFFISLNNYINRKQQQAHKKRQERLAYLRKKIEDKDFFMVDTKLVNELNRQREKKSNEIKILLFIVSLLYFLYFLLKFLDV